MPVVLSNEHSCKILTEVKDSASRRTSSQPPPFNKSKADSINEAEKEQVIPKEITREENVGTYCKNSHTIMKFG